MPEVYLRRLGAVNLREKLPDVSRSGVQRWRRPRRPGINMDRTEVVVCKANDETVFRDFREHWLFGISKAKMVTTGGPEFTFRRPLKCPDNGECLRLRAGMDGRIRSEG